MDDWSFSLFCMWWRYRNLWKEIMGVDWHQIIVGGLPLNRLPKGKRLIRLNRGQLFSLSFMSLFGLLIHNSWNLSIGWAWGRRVYWRQRVVRLARTLGIMRGTDRHPRLELSLSSLSRWQRCSLWCWLIVICWGRSGRKLPFRSSRKPNPQGLLSVVMDLSSGRNLFEGLWSLLGRKLWK